MTCLNAPVEGFYGLLLDNLLIAQPNSFSLKFIPAISFAVEKNPLVTVAFNEVGAVLCGQLRVAGRILQSATYWYSIFCRDFKEPARLLWLQRTCGPAALHR